MDKVRKKTNVFLPLIIAFILGDVLCENYIVKICNGEPGGMKVFAITSLLILQVFAAPIQAGFSDFYCRKKSLVFSLCVSFFALIFGYFFLVYELHLFPLLMLIILAKSLFGNTIPISWAAIADTQERDLRFSLALSTAPYAIGYLTIGIFNSFFDKTHSILTTIIIFFVLIIVCMVFFKDVRDKRSPSFEHSHKKRTFFNLIHGEMSLIRHELREKKLRFGLSAYLFWATSQYSVLVLLADFKEEYPEAVLIMMVGYLIGVGLMYIFRRIADEIIIRVGYYLSVIVLLAFFTVIPFVNNIYPMLTASYFFYSIGNAFLSPTILTMLSKDRKPHQQGKVFGYIESADSLGFLLGMAVIFLYILFGFSIIHIVAFSLICFISSWYPYLKYLELRKEPKSL
jgi:MFS family permease